MLPKIVVQNSTTARCNTHPHPSAPVDTEASKTVGYNHDAAVQTRVRILQLEKEKSRLRVIKKKEMQLLKQARTQIADATDAVATTDTGGASTVQSASSVSKAARPVHLREGVCIMDSKTVHSIQQDGSITTADGTVHRKVLYQRERRSIIVETHTIPSKSKHEYSSTNPTTHTSSSKIEKRSPLGRKNATPTQQPSWKRNRIGCAAQN
uniref:Obscurin n=1 Tax=Lygus hesperus TaxID=30085 RepID=A0A0A9YSQ8_LYGHE